MDNTEHMSAAEYRELLKQYPPPENPWDAASVRNHISSDRGREFEYLIMTGCDYYADRRRAVIGKVYEPYRCLKKYDGGRFLGQWVGRAEPDFKGVLRGGRAIAFEAKSTKKSRIQKSALTNEQAEWLDAQAEMGAVVFVCVEIKDRFFSIPWYVWRDMRSVFGKKFLMPGDIAEYEVACDGAVRFLDYMNGRRLDGDTYALYAAEGGSRDGKV